MSGFLCSMVGASFAVAAEAEVLRSKKAITAVGNAQVDTAQSKFGGSALLCDGTGDYLEVANNFSWHNQSAGTIEFFFRLNSTVPFAQGLFSQCIQGAATGLQLLTVNNRLNLYKSATTAYEAYNVNIVTGQFYHIAIVKESSTTVKFYVDGTLRHTDSSANGFTDSAANFFIGRGFGLSSGLWDGTRYDLNGWIDEFRISNTARYTANFTPSTTPFVNDANTLLLIHADGTDATTFFEDDNGVRASRSLIAIGNAQVDTAQSKFGGSALLCDGTGDYVRSIAGSHFDFGTGDFTIEYWIRFNAINTLYVPIALRSGAGIGNGEWWCEVQAADNKMYWGFKNQAGTTFYANFPVIGTAMTTGSFHHIAVVKSGSTLTQYLNGTANGNVGTGLSGSFGISTTDLWVGAGAGAYSVNGWLDEIRISNSARYTTTFTPSTTPFVNDANTLFLMHADGTDAATVFRDDNGSRTQIGIQALGNAQVDTAQSKFGGASALFDGTGDHLLIPGSSDWRWNTTNYTIEFWTRVTTHKNTGSNNLPAQIGSMNPNSGTAFWNFGTDDAGKITFHYYNGAVTKVAGSTNLSTGVQYHLAMVYTSSDNTIKLYVDGTQAASAVVSGTPQFSDSLALCLGQYNSVGYNGHMDELRVSNIARYTAGFTAPTAPFQNDSNTLLLLHMDGTDGSTVFFDDNGVTPTHSYT